MTNNEETSSDDLYAILGLNKECTTTELRTAYKKLALRWHPDRCSASGNSEFVEEAKKKFQGIQQAYAVLSDSNKRFLYDVGAYDSDDDEIGMGDFLNEMSAMMRQSKPTDGVEESFEQLQELFNEMFQGDIGTVGSCSVRMDPNNDQNNKTEMNSGKMKSDEAFGFEPRSLHFSIGVEHQQDFKKGKGVKGVRGGSSSTRRLGRKQKVSSSGYDMSSSNYGISTS